MQIPPPRPPSAARPPPVAGLRVAIGAAIGAPRVSAPPPPAPPRQPTRLGSSSGAPAGARFAGAVLGERAARAEVPPPHGLHERDSVPVQPPRPPREREAPYNLFHGGEVPPPRAPYREPRGGSSGSIGAGGIGAGGGGLGFQHQPSKRDDNAIPPPSAPYRERAERQEAPGGPPPPRTASFHSSDGSGLRRSEANQVRPSAPPAPAGAETPAQISARLASVVDTLLSNEIPSPSDLSQALEKPALANLVIALAVKLKEVREQAARGGLEAAAAVSVAAAAEAPSGSAAAREPAETSWAWGTGRKEKEDTSKDNKERKGSRSRDRDRRSRSRRRDSRRSRSRQRDRDRDRDRRDDARAEPRAARPAAPTPAEPKKLGPDIEERTNGFRASCTFPGDRGNAVTSVGPWRKTREQAQQDCDALVNAFGAGGDPEVQKEKRRLHLVATKEGGNDVSDFFANAAKGEYSWPTDIEGPSDKSSTLGGYRCSCTFPSNKSMTYDGAKPRRPITVKGPWRMGSNSQAKAAAEADARALCEGYDEAGDEGMQAKKKEMFKWAEEDAKVARQSRSSSAPLSNIFVGGPPDDQEDALNEAGEAPTKICTVEEDSKKGSDNRGYRAKCIFQVPMTKGDGTYPVHVSGPWRKRRSEADADSQELGRAFDEGGINRANARRMEMRREDAEGPQSEEAPKGEISEDEMVSRYGKGYALLAGMGFAAGGGLGRDLQGRTTPVEAVGVQTLGSTKHVGLGFALGGDG